MNDRKRAGRPVTLAALGLVFAITACLAWYYDVYVYWKPAQYTLSVAALMALFAALAFLATRRLWKTAVALASLVVSIFVPAVIINNVLKRGVLLAGAVSVILSGACVLVLCALLLRKTRKAPLGIAMAAIMLVTGVTGFGGLAYMRNYTAPTGAGRFEGTFEPMAPLGEADYVVPHDGGIEEVRDAIRALRTGGEDRHFTVLIEDGEYNIRQLAFNARDKNTTYRSRDGGVILNGGFSLDPKDFTDFDENIKAIDLTKLGLTAGDWGKLYSFGAFTTAGKYDDGTGPLACELFYNGARCTTARYPNADAKDPWIYIDKVLDPGETNEGDAFPEKYNPAWETMRNPRGGTFTMDGATAERAAKWSNPGGAWMYGFFWCDWADMSTPIEKIDLEAGTITGKYASLFGGYTARGAGHYAAAGYYYIYNVLEELDQPGEWYLDRETGILYLWPADDDFNNSRVDISISTETLIAGEGPENITLMGLTFQGTRGDGISLAGNNITIDNCVVRNVAGSAMNVNGYNNTVSNCEVTRVGKAGIDIGGGEIETLTPGNSRAVNNMVHAVGEIQKMYAGAINVSGTGNLIAHNEIFNTPHSAMFPGGPLNVIEYNHIYDVVRESGDAGAIYGGGGRGWWSSYGTVIRYNYIHDIGGGKFHPVGIYMDDAPAGIKIHGNLLVNGGSIGLSGGRDMDVRGNIVVNKWGVLGYDDRARTGALDPDNWWYAGGSGCWVENGYGWQSLFASPWQTDIWKEAFPKLAAISPDFSDADNPNFGPNPALSVITGNVFVGDTPSLSDAAKRFSTIENNAQYSTWQLNSLFADPKNGDYRLKENSRILKKLPGFEGIPLEKIGRGKQPVS